MGKTNFRRMMMLRDHDRDREPERDRLEEERDRRERELERRLRKLEGSNDRYPYYPQEENLFRDSSHHSFFAFYCFLTTFYHLGRYSMQSFFALHL